MGPARWPSLKGTTLMGYEGWVAVCPRCGVQNGSKLNACSNCGQGPILCQRRKLGRTEYRDYQCQICRVEYSDTCCRKCGTYIGGVTNRTPIKEFIRFAIIAVLVLFFLYQCGRYSESHPQRSGGLPALTRFDDSGAATTSPGRLDLAPATAVGLPGSDLSQCGNRLTT
jgi:hypothetical protein